MEKGSAVDARKREEVENDWAGGYGAERIRCEHFAYRYSTVLARSGVGGATMAVLGPVQSKKVGTWRRDASDFNGALCLEEGRLAMARNARPRKTGLLRPPRASDARNNLSRFLGYCLEQ